MAARARRRSGRSPARGRPGTPEWVKVIGIAALLAVAGAGGWALWRQQRGDQVDARLCPLDGATGSLAILLDLTDPVGATQSVALRAELERRVVESPRGTLVSLGRVSDRGDEMGATVALCRPMTGTEGGEWTRNPTQLDRRFQSGFLKPFEAALADMLDARQAKESPIMEGLQALLAGVAATGVEVAGPRQIVIVSDLIQNSEALSFYRGEDWASFKASPNYRRLARNLDGAEVILFLVPRKGGKVDPAAVEDFWVQYLDVQGAGAVKPVPLGDL